MVTNIVGAQVRNCVHYWGAKVTQHRRLLAVLPCTLWVYLATTPSYPTYVSESVRSMFREMVPPQPATSSSTPRHPVVVKVKKPGL